MRIDYEKLVPESVALLYKVHEHIQKSGVDPVLAELASLRTSQINGCAFCIELHSKILRHQGVSFEKLLLVSAWREAGSVFNEKEQAVLLWSESLTSLAKTHAPDSDFNKMKMHFSEKEIANFTVAIALTNAYNRIAVGMRRLPEAASKAS
ncbi:carboxymuconolactone decarboxylase family protein [Acetobacteraceae bacterium]|nr:carboxymuconolactone decarboxylase family protein [Acetobacteraceae bacterium]